MPTSTQCRTLVKPTTRSDAEINRISILRATRNVCSETGDNFSVKEIAEAAHVSTATIYRHFNGKKALMDEVSLTRWRHLIDMLVQPNHGTELHRVIAVLDTYTRMCSADSTFLEALQIRPGFGRLAEQMREVFDPRFSDLWLNAQARGLIRRGTNPVDIIDLTSGIRETARREHMLRVLMTGIVSPDFSLDRLLAEAPGAGKRDVENHFFSLAC